jgi:hypothetical protein
LRVLFTAPVRAARGNICRHGLLLRWVTPDERLIVKSRLNSEVMLKILISISVEIYQHTESLLQILEGIRTAK